MQVPSNLGSWTMSKLRCALATMPTVSHRPDGIASPCRRKSRSEEWHEVTLVSKASRSRGVI